MIKTINLTKKYDDKLVVDNLNLQIDKGELYSLLGVNGAGKTTTIKMLTTLTAPTSGEIYIKGEKLSPNSKCKQIMNISPQESAVAPNLTVKENLLFIANIYNIKNSNEKVNELLNTFSLIEYKNQKAKTLSGGLIRRLSLAMSLINDPEILFLDEPTLGLDVISRRELQNIIKSLKNKTTIILTTHYLEEAQALSSKIGIISKGKLMFEGTSEEILNFANTKNFEEAFIKIACGGDKL